MISNILICISAGILLLLGTLHLVFTFHGQKFFPRHDTLQATMDSVAPRISDQTTMWRAWIGFNASHSIGAMLFGLVYGYLAVFQAPILFGSVFLQVLGITLLSVYVVLARRYWFATPFAGISIALICFVVAVLV